MSDTQTTLKGYKLAKQSSPTSRRQIAFLHFRSMLSSETRIGRRVVSRLDDAIGDFLHQQQASRSYCQTLGAPLSPVQHTPPELLGEVFQFCLPTNYREKGAHQVVMLPSHICRHWRNVALSTPRLWTKINLYVTDKNLELRTALVTAWFSRSGASSLSLTLTGWNVRPILDVVLPYCHRWQQIHLSMPPEMFQCLEQARGNLQRLETVYMHIWDASKSHLAQHIFESAPKLRTLSLGGDFAWDSLNIPWAQLTEFDVVSCGGVAECLEMLQCMENLQKLAIRLQDGDMGMRTLRPFVLDFHLLTSLRVWGGGHIGIFFDHLSLPALHYLILDDVGFDWPQTQFIAFLSRSSPRLRSFSFGSSDDCMIDDNLIEILQHTPSLVSLSLSYFDCNACITGTLLDRLSPRILENEHVDCLVPKLKTISIQLPDEGLSLNFQALTKMIISRWRLAHAVQTVDSDCRPIERIRVVKIVSLDEECIDEVLEGLAPLRGLVDTVYIKLDSIDGCGRYTWA